jgi:NADH:ubiquinone oxidoreductase subunit 5 (subunit L)/multisubunit Na+/H+ antiporter MnhA subunit
MWIFNSSNSQYITSDWWKKNKKEKELKRSRKSNFACHCWNALIMSILPMYAYTFRMKLDIFLYKKHKKKQHKNHLIHAFFLLFFSIIYCHSALSLSCSLHVVSTIAHRNNELIWQRLRFTFTSVQCCLICFIFFPLFCFASLAICPSSLLTTYSDALVYATCKSHLNWKIYNEI